MSGCFPIPPIHLDLHNIRSFRNIPRLSNRHRSKSESDVLTEAYTKHASTSSLPCSPRSSSPAPRQRRGSGGSGTGRAGRRQRFVRVVRNDELAGEEFDNPHIVRRYTKQYWDEANIMRSKSMEESIHALPYDIPANTILKRHLSFSHDDLSKEDHPNTTSSPDPNAKHPQFCDDVKVIEFDQKEKIKKNIVFMHEEKLHEYGLDRCYDDRVDEEDFEEHGSMLDNINEDTDEKNNEIVSKGYDTVNKANENVTSDNVTIDKDDTMILNSKDTFEDSFDKLNITSRSNVAMVNLNAGKS